MSERIRLKPNTLYSFSDSKGVLLAKYVFVML